MSVLDDILGGVRVDLAERQSLTSIDDLKTLASRQEPALNPMPGYRADGVSVIAEVKRSSPSRGDLAVIRDPAALARDYAEGGHDDQRAHGGPAVRWQPRRPACGASGGIGAGAA
jgi:indole-3-glycerol phosphate synthase